MDKEIINNKLLIAILKYLNEQPDVLNHWCSDDLKENKPQISSIDQFSLGWDYVEDDGWLGGIGEREDPNSISCKIYFTNYLIIKDEARVFTDKYFIDEYFHEKKGSSDEYDKALTTELSEFLIKEGINVLGIELDRSRALGVRIKIAQPQVYGEVIY